MTDVNTVCNILIVDDNNENRRVLATILSADSRFDLTLARDGASALAHIRTQLPDLILLDIMMPGMDGYQVAQQLKSDPRTKDIPILFVTANTDSESISKGFRSGGVDYITKPFNHDELLARVHVQVSLKLAQDQLQEQNRLLSAKKELLSSLVDEKTKEIEDMTLALITALESANIMNDTDTGKHIKRVSAYAGILASAYTGEPDFVHQIKLYSSLHDVGKVGIPDALLKKPGEFSPSEMEAMKQHVSYGGQMLNAPGIPPLAANIARYHHEKWDGTGYLEGLSGSAIPMEARIVTLADVYDALGTRRVYKDAFAEEEIDSTILAGKGSHFDPELVDIFFTVKQDLLQIKETF